jgi:putative redox protein
MDMEVYFPGNKKVYARYKDFVIETDQSTHAGGDGTAPAPFDLFLVSIGTCAGIFVLSFMQQRGISPEGAGITLRTERDRDSGLISKISIEIKLPPEFPEKYHDAIIRVAEQCSVKRHIDQPPVFETYVATA